MTPISLSYPLPRLSAFLRMLMGSVATEDIRRWGIRACGMLLMEQMRLSVVIATGFFGVPDDRDSVFLEISTSYLVICSCGAFLGRFCEHSSLKGGVKVDDYTLIAV